MYYTVHKIEITKLLSLLINYEILKLIMEHWSFLAVRQRETRRQTNKRK